MEREDWKAHTLPFALIPTLLHSFWSSPRFIPSSSFTLKATSISPKIFGSQQLYLISQIYQAWLNVLLCWKTGLLQQASISLAPSFRTFDRKQLKIQIETLVLDWSIFNNARAWKLVLSLFTFTRNALVLTFFNKSGLPDKKNIQRYCLGSDKLHSINICLIVDDTVLQVFMCARELRALCVVFTPVLSDTTFHTLDQCGVRCLLRSVR